MDDRVQADRILGTERSDAHSVVAQSAIVQADRILGAARCVSVCAARERQHALVLPFD